MSDRHINSHTSMPGVGSDMPNISQYREEEHSVRSLSVEEIEYRTAMEGIYVKKSIFKDDINAFLNSLNEDEFAIYMNQKQEKGEDIWDTGRHNVTNSFIEGEDISDLREQKLLEEVKAHDLSIQDGHGFKVPEVFDLMSFQEFYQIFQVDCFDELPLFIKLFYLKEIMQFNTLHESRAFTWFTGFLLSMNGGYYYFMRNIYYSNKVKMISIPRFWIMFFLGDLLYKEAIIKGHLVNTHMVDINPLLNTDDLHYFEDPYYRAFIKRIATLYPHLLHEDYDISDIIDENNEIYDKHFSKRIYHSYDPSVTISIFNKTFAIHENVLNFDSSSRAFEKMMNKYSEFFDYKHEEFRQDVSNHLIDLLALQNSTMQALAQIESESMAKNKQEINHLTKDQIKLPSFKFDPNVCPNTKEVLSIYQKSMNQKIAPKSKDLLEWRINEAAIEKFKDKGRYLPQKTMSYREFMSIQQYFKAVDFERSSMLTFSLPWAIVMTYMIKRIVTRI